MANMKVDIKEDYIKGGTQKEFYKEPEKEKCTCLLCGANNYEHIANERGLSVVRCKECELLYTNPRAVDTEKNYFGDINVFFDEARMVFKGQRPHHRDRNYIFELKAIKKLKPEGSRLLDIGSNMGFYLRIAKQMGFNAEGVEPSPSLATLAEKQWNIKIHNGFLEDVNLPEKHYDVISLIDVFEHVTNPSELLISAGKILKDDGIIVIKVPNGDYNLSKQKLAKLMGKSGMDIWDCREHVAHYTYATFRKMAEKSGFKIKKFIIPIPIHTPVWQNLVGHYYLHTSPTILDLKRIIPRNMFYYAGCIENIFSKKNHFAPDLMFMIEKK
jgi:2-polyprenyl-3-methyl-5-hydroxy-6-metoxy-1,4-benzoquinol methylase